MSRVYVTEGCRIRIKADLDCAKRAVAVFGDDELGHILVGRIKAHFVAVFAVNEDNHVGVLFDRTRVTKVGEAGDAAVTTFNATREL